MDEHGVSDYHHGQILGEEPACNGAVRSQCGDPRPENLQPISVDSTERERDTSEWILWDSQPGAESLHLVSDGEPVSPVVELIQTLLRDISEIPLDVHNLMVSIHGDDATAGSSSLPSQFLEKVEYLYLLSATVENVADLDEGSRAANPFVGGVNEVGETERLLGLVEISMDVAESNEAVRRRNARLQVGL